MTLANRDFTDDVVILMYAFRYALGRQSYAVRDVAAALLRHRSALSADWRQQIVQDIHNAIKEERAGSAHDIATWEEVARAMR